MITFLKDEAANLLSRSAQPRTAPEEGLPDSDLVLWLDASQDVEATDAGTVLKWSDRSGRGHHAHAQGDPLLIRDGLNGQPVIRLDGNHDWFSLAGQVVNDSRHSIVAMVNDTSQNGHRNLIGNWDGPNGNSASSVFLGTTGEGSRSVRFTDDFTGSPGAMELLDPHEFFLLTSIADAQNARVFQNATLIGEKGAAIAARKLDTAWTVGRQGTFDGEYWDGDVAEILVFDAALNDTDRLRVWWYLARKYNLVALDVEPKPLTATEAHRLALIQVCRVILNLNEFVYAD